MKLSCLLFNLGMITKKCKKHTFKRPSLSSEYLCFTVQAIKSQNIITNATKRKSRDKNCSSMCCGVPGAAGGGRPSFILNAVAKIPNGKAPIPNDIWNPPSPNPKPWNPPRFSGSGLCPCGRGGVLSRGSCCPVLPLPYSGITLSRLIPALHTGHTCLVGRVSNHWCRQGQQKRCPHRLMTASLAVSRHMLHSNVLSWLLLESAAVVVLLDEVPVFSAEEVAI